MPNIPFTLRMLNLLEKAADAFTRNQNPFEVEWLSHQEVKLQECVDLTEWIGRVLEDYVCEQKTKEGGDAD